MGEKSRIMMLDDFCCIPRFTQNLAFFIENLLLDADTISGIKFFLHLNTVFNLSILVKLLHCPPWTFAEFHVSRL